MKGGETKMEKEKTIYTNQLQKTDMECSVCKKKRECSSRAEGKFCESFRSETFIPGKRKPLKVWETERKATWEMQKNDR
jgi:hypothetical protein